MYYTEKILYLLWEGDKPEIRRSHNRSPSPLPNIRSRSRSPSPPSSPELRRRSSFSRQPHRYIQYDSLKVLNDLGDLLKNWHEVSEKYIENTLNISFGIPYKILNIFLNPECDKVAFKVLAYELDLDTITTKIMNDMKLSIPILSVSSMNKYLANPNTTSIKVNFSLSHIPIFVLTGRDRFSVSITLDELDETTKKCFDAYRNLCRSDKVLTELFEKSITQYFDSAREHTGLIVREFLESQK